AVLARITRCRDRRGNKLPVRGEGRRSANAQGPKESAVGAAPKLHSGGSQLLAVGGVGAEKRTTATEAAALRDGPKQHPIGRLPEFVFLVVRARGQLLSIGRKGGVPNEAGMLPLPDDLRTALGED